VVLPILAVIGGIVVAEVVAAVSIAIINEVYDRNGIPSVQDQAKTVTEFAAQKLKDSGQNEILVGAGLIGLALIPVGIAIASGRKSRALKEGLGTIPVGFTTTARILAQRALVAAPFKGQAAKLGISFTRLALGNERDVIGLRKGAENLLDALLPGGPDNFVGDVNRGITSSSGNKVIVTTHPRLAQSMNANPALIFGLPKRMVFVQHRRRRLFVPEDEEEFEI